MPPTINSREFNQDVGRAKRLADAGPVMITDRGKPAYVLMTHGEYLRLVGKAPSIVDLLDHPKNKDIEFEPERLRGGAIRRVRLD